MVSAVVLLLEFQCVSFTVHQPEEHARQRLQCLRIYLGDLQRQRLILHADDGGRVLRALRRDRELYGLHPPEAGIVLLDQPVLPFRNADQRRNAVRTRRKAHVADLIHAVLAL